MSSLNFIRTEVSAAIARGVRQCVLIGSPPAPEAFESGPDKILRVFEVAEEPSSDSPAIFVPTEFASEALASALEQSDFDKLKATLFVWLGGSGYRTLETAMASLAFIASLPTGTGVVLDYVAERTSFASRTHSALDALACRILLACGSLKFRIQPQAVTAMLRGFGFQKILDLAQDGPALNGPHLVSASL